MIGCVRGLEGRDFGEKEWFKKSLREEDEEEHKNTDGGECSCNWKCNIVIHLSASVFDTKIAFWFGLTVNTRSKVTGDKSAKSKCLYLL